MRKQPLIELMPGVFAHSSAGAAYFRVWVITRMDREAVPCGRWVKSASVDDPFYRSFAVQGMCASINDPPLWRMFRRHLKPRYRYEVRR